MSPMSNFDDFVTKFYLQVSSIVDVLLAPVPRHRCQQSSLISIQLSSDAILSAQAVIFTPLVESCLNPSQRFHFF